MRFKSDPEALVLAALANGPQHGYGVVKLLRDGSSGIFNLNEGQLYPLLHKMQAAGWIRGNWETPDGGPARKTYVLLEDGHKQLEIRRAEWREFSSAFDGLLLAPEANHG